MDIVWKSERLSTCKYWTAAMLFTNKQELCRLYKQYSPIVPSQAWIHGRYLDYEVELIYTATEHRQDLRSDLHSVLQTTSEDILQNTINTNLSLILIPSKFKGQCFNVKIMNHKLISGLLFPKRLSLAYTIQTIITPTRLWIKKKSGHYNGPRNLQEHVRLSVLTIKFK